MQNNSNKWRAFIITFIIITLLLVVGYFLLKKTGSDTSTKGETIAQKFSSLFGTSKQKQINTVVDTGLGNLNPTVPPIKVDEGTDQNVPGSSTPPGQGGTTKPATPGLNPFPYTPGNSNGNYVYNPGYQAKSQCDDGADNDGDGSVDKNDAGCHTDLDATNSSTYDSWLEDESAENGPNVIVDKVTPGGCVPNRNIIFTPDEQKRISELLRDFYRLAPNLATREDITIETGNAKAYQETIDSATEYTNQCYNERKINSPSASNAPQKIKRVEYADTKTQDGLVDENKMWMTVPTGKYMLEVKKSPLFTSTKIAPSDTFLPGYQGFKFETPVVSPTMDVRKMLYRKGGAFGNYNDIWLSRVIQYADGDTAGAAISAHVLQGFKDVGILKYYFPNKNYTTEDYDTVLKMFREQVNKYMNKMKPERDFWADHVGHNDLSDFQDWGINPYTTGDTQQYGHGFYKTRDLLDSYLKSGDTDEVRFVDIGAASWILMNGWDWKTNGYEKKDTNLYQQFEQKYKKSIW